MKFLGCYDENQLPIIIGFERYALLFTYLEDKCEVKIYYDRCKPFQIVFVAILLEETSRYSMYDLFEYIIPAETELDAKTSAKKFANEITQYRKNLIKYYQIKSNRHL